MGLSNMLSKLFKKEGEDVSVQNPVKFKDFDSIILPPEPKPRGILVYKTVNLGLECTSGSTMNGVETAEEADAEHTEDPAELNEDVAPETEAEEA